MMRRSTIVGLLTCATALLAVGLAFAQTKSTASTARPGTLTGEVSDKRGTPLAGSAVTATRVESKQSSTSTTDAGGVFRIDGLEPGDYEISYNAKGFLPATEKTKIKPGKTTKVHARLKFVNPES